jgi:predicted Zn-dependent protease
VRETRLSSEDRRDGPVRSRTTAFELVRLAGRLTETTLGSRPAASCPPDAPAQLELPEDLLRPGAAGTALTARVAVQAGVRMYDDSDGRHVEVSGDWVDVVVRAEQVGAPPLSVYGGTASVGQVSGLLADLADDLRIVPTGPLATLSRPRADLVLAPPVAAVLLHELVGHGAEELGRTRTPMVVGPSDLSVTAVFPRPGATDDEGVRTMRMPLVEAGVLTGPVLDRERAAREGGAPAGLAQAAWHGGPPRARCTHLLVGPGTAGDDLRSSLNGGLWCTASSGAELIDGVAVVAVDRAWRFGRGQLIEPLQPFLMSVPMRDLARHLKGVGGDPVTTRPGRCVKGLQAVPTMASMPSLLLENVPVHAY